MAEYATIDIDGLKQRLDDSQTEIINVLDNDQFFRQHIPGSVNIPVESPDFEARVAELTGGDKSTPLVVYCHDTNCQASPGAAQRLTELGYTNVFDFEGGVMAWKEAGLDIAQGQITRDVTS